MQVNEIIISIDALRKADIDSVVTSAESVKLGLVFNYLAVLFIGMTSLSTLSVIQ